jgi:hypothetical protein
VLPETLDVLPMVHLVSVVERKDGLRARVGYVSKLKGRPLLARQLLLRRHEG